LEESKGHCSLQKKPRMKAHRITGWSACPPWEANRLVNPGNHFQAHEGQEKQEE